MIGQTGAAKNEFIELYNPTGNDIDLTKYGLKKKTKSGAESNLVSSLKFSGVIPAHGYFLITHPDYKDTINADIVYSGTTYSISSNNTIILYDPENNVVDKVGYGAEAGDFEGKAGAEPENNQSIERQPTGHDSDNNSADFFIQDTPTPQNSGGQSIETEQSESDSFKPATDYPPMAEAGPDITAITGQKISFDGGLSSDPDWDNLTYFWNFGDGATSAEKSPSHAYNFPGQYIISLATEDSKFTALDTAVANIYSSGIVISEFAPDQWIEIHNQDSQIANLSGWKLNDFVFPDHTLVAPDQFLIFDQPDCSGDVQLFYPDGSLASQVAYSENSSNGQCVAFDGAEYFWSKIPTPGLANIISAAGLAEESGNNIGLSAAKEVRATPTVSGKMALASNNRFSVSGPAAEAGVETETSAENADRQSDLATAGNNILSGQAINISQSALSEQKAKMILILSIIVSASLLVAWVMILIRRKIA